jgi:hypothetical protein
MDIFVQNKRLKFSVVILVLLNLTTMFFFIRNFGHKENGRKEPDHARVTAILAKELDLTEAQKEEFKHIRNRFFEKEELLAALIKSRRDSMNVEMFNAQTDTLLLRRLSKNIATDEGRMENYRIQQSFELKKICTSKQLEKFSQFVKEIRDYFKPVKK